MEHELFFPPWVNSALFKKKSEAQTCTYWTCITQSCLFPLYRELINRLVLGISVFLIWPYQGRMLDVSAMWTLTFWSKKSVFTYYTIQLLWIRVLSNNQISASQLSLKPHPPATVSSPIPPPAGFAVVEGRRLVAVVLRGSTRAHVTASMVLPSCHRSGFSSLTNMPWHPWPSSPIYDQRLCPFFFSAEFLFVLEITPHSMIPATCSLFKI